VVRAGAHYDVALELVPVPLPMPAASAPIAPMPPDGAVAPKPTPDVERSGTRTALLASGAVLSVVALGAGVVLRVVAGDKRSGAEDATADLVRQRGPAPCAGAYAASAECTTIGDDLSGADGLGNAGTAMLIGGGVVGAATLVYWVATRSSMSSPAASAFVAPYVGPGAAGVAAIGRF
jgi:hypothetical protein